MIHVLLDVNDVENHLEGTQYAFQVRAIDNVVGREFTHYTDWGSFEEVLKMATQMEELLEVFHTIMREPRENDRGMITIGTWRIRGDHVMAVSIVIVYKEPGK